MWVTCEWDFWWFFMGLYYEGSYLLEILDALDQECYLNEVYIPINSCLWYKVIWDQKIYFWEFQSI